MIVLPRLRCRWKLVSLLTLITLLGIMAYSGFTSDILRIRLLPSSGAHVTMDTFEYAGGPRTLEWQIILSDVIARVKLRSVAQTTEQLQYGDQNYVGALEFTFDVLEYLKGGGGDQLTALAVNYDVWYDTQQEAALGEDLLSERETRWDAREAIIFLEDNYELVSTEQQDRYWLGDAKFGRQDFYTIESAYHITWLPDAAPPPDDDVTQAATGLPVEGEQRFLLRPPWDTNLDAEAPPTLSVAELKTRIAELEAEVNAGTGLIDYALSGYTLADYAVCIAEKYEYEKRMKYWTDDGRKKYYHYVIDVELTSGLPSGSLAYSQLQDPDWLGIAFSWHETYGDQALAEYNEKVLDWIDGTNAALFTPKPFSTWTVRPLPAREYTFYYKGISKDYAICDALPKEEKERAEVVLTVTAPAGTVHEAFFDPVTLTGTGVGADTTANGDLSPASFTIGDADGALQSLTWQGGSVVLTLSPYVSLTGNAIDFIELDGSVSLTLSADAATVDSAAGTLTWSVATQPWHDGDLLMLRIRDATVPAQNSVPPALFPPELMKWVTPTPEPTVIPTVEPTVEPTVIPTVEPTAEPTAIPTPEPTAVPSPSVSAVSLSFSPGTTVKSRVWVSLSVEAETVPANTDVERHIQIQSGDAWLTISTDRVYWTTTTNAINTYRGGARISGSTDGFTYSSPLTITWTP